MLPKFITSKEAARLINDGSTIANVSMTMIGCAEEFFVELENRFLEEGHPKDITLFHPAGFSDQKYGIEHLAHKGLLKKLVGSHWGLAPKIMKMINDCEVEAYCMPFGVLCNMFHDMCGKKPGSISKIGLHTFLDPRQEAGQMNKISTEEMVSLIDIQGEECLLYKHIPLDFLVIKGTYADENGNISMKNEPLLLEDLSAALATKRYGGKVIVQVQRIVEKDSIPCKEVEIPGSLVDYIYVCENPEKNHRQTSSFYLDDSFSGLVRVPKKSIPSVPLSARKIIVRRALQFLKENSLINNGTGIPNDSLGSILAEEGLSEKVTLTIESGVYGGVPLGGPDFGVSQNASALIRQNMQFDLYNGRGVDFTFMGCGEVDQYGNVNVTKMGNIAPGCGGFVDITANAKNIVFCSTFTGKGLKVEFDEEQGIKIINEGSLIKFKENVRQISFNGKYNAERGAKIFHVTERAVFEITLEGLVLIEIAKGVDLQKDILDQMEFKPIISESLSTIDTSIYIDGKFGLKLKE